MSHAAQLLKQHPLLNSESPREVREQVSQYLWPHKMTMTSKQTLKLEMSGVFFGNSALFNLHYGANVEIDTSELSDSYLIRATLAGTGKISCSGESVELASGSLSVSSPGNKSHIQMDANCRNLLLRVERDALETQLNQLLERTAKEPLVFALGQDSTQQGSINLLNTLYYICQVYESEHELMAPVLSDHLSDYLSAMLLTQLQHNYSDDLQRGPSHPAPYYVKKAKDYIEQNLDKAITLSTLSQISGTSVRTLQNAFNHFTNQSPTEYIRSQRLMKIHQELLTAKPSEKVTDIALRNGINSLGHFSKAYKKHFGCTPSETLNKR